MSKHFENRPIFYWAWPKSGHASRPLLLGHKHPPFPRSLCNCYEESHSTQRSHIFDIIKTYP